MSLAAVEAAGWERARAGSAPGDASPCPLGTVTVDDIVVSPPIGCTGPTSFAFSPDGSLLCCLFSAEGTQTRQLWALEPLSGEAAPLLSSRADGDAALSHEEQLRREIDLEHVSFLPKPFSVQQIAAKVAGVMGQAAQA